MRSKDIVGIKILSPKQSAKKALSELSAIADKWSNINTQYCDRSFGDPGYCYNERANISLLSAGVWASGNIALEEFTNQKISKIPSSKLSIGRVDLYIHTQSYGFFLEAKHHWMRATMTDSTLVRCVEQFLKTATLDAEKTPHTSARLGCVFFIPSFRLEKFQKFDELSDEYINKELDRYQEQCGKYADIWAWSFPNSTRSFKAKGVGGWIHYPGVIMALKFGRHFRT